jgi:hypothetical protein
VVLSAELAAVQDDDARENYTVFLRFRDGLLAAGTLEAYYLQLMRSGVVNVPAVFIDAVVQAITPEIRAGRSRRRRTLAPAPVQAGQAATAGIHRKAPASRAHPGPAPESHIRARNQQLASCEGPLPQEEERCGGAVGSVKGRTMEDGR